MKLLKKVYRRFRAYIVGLRLQKIAKERFPGTAIVFKDRANRVALGVVPEEFTFTKALLEDLDFVITTCKDNSIPYFFVPVSSCNYYRVGILSEYRSEFIQSIKETHSIGPRYIGAINSKQKHPYYRQSFISSDFVPRDEQQIECLKIWHNVLTPANHLLIYDQSNGVEVEFWMSAEKILESEERVSKISSFQFAPFGFSHSGEDADSIKNAWYSLRRNPYTNVLFEESRLRAEINIYGTLFSTFSLFTKKTIDQVVFPIDVVYTWVDNNDQKWREEYQRFEHPDDVNNTESRYVSRDELKYSLRSLHMYASWVNHIYIVTAGQKPEWLVEDHPKITIVNHKDIFRDPDKDLPTFNSHAIEANLHHIKGLARHYIYFCDDYFVGKNLSPKFSFTGGGLLVVTPSKVQNGFGRQLVNESATYTACKNTSRLIERDFDKIVCNTFKHIPAPQDRDLLFEIEERYSQEHSLTSSSRFRAKTDFAFAGQLIHNYALATGRAVARDHQTTVIRITDDNAERRMNELLRSRDKQTFCLNDTDKTGEDPEAITQSVSRFLESYFPFKAPWEKSF